MTPLAEGGRIILPAGGPGAALVALDAHDGRTIWTAGDNPASYCPALSVTFQGRRIIVGYLKNALILVDAATGKLLHRQSLSSGYDEHSAWPLYEEPYLLLTAPFHARAVRLQLQAGPDESLLCRQDWSCRELSNDVLSSVLHEGHVYGFDLKQLQASRHGTSRGIFKCLEWSTGKVRWSTDEIGHASVLVADGKLLLLNDTGSLILARTDPTAYRELARTQLFENETCWTPPTLWRGRLFVRSPSRAVCPHVGRPEDAPAGVEAVAPPARSWRLASRQLLSREREYPNDPFSWEEMALWFGFSVAMLGGAALTTRLVLLTTRRLPGPLLFWGQAFLLGLLGPNLLSTLVDRCLFTWPLSLYAAFHLTLWIGRSAEGQSARRRWLARLALVGLLLACYGYFELCGTGGMYIGWYFLFGFIPALPFTFLAVRAQVKQERLAIVAAWTLLAFAVFFWSCQAVLLWKAEAVVACIPLLAGI